MAINAGFARLKTIGGCMSFYDPVEREKFYTAISEIHKEPLANELKGHLKELIQIIKNVGEPLEGNIFFNNLEKNIDGPYFDNYLNKRRALAVFATAHSSLLEIGFNSGFSALLMLVANSKIKITSIDICEHKYTIPCFEYLRNNFGDRISLVKGNSLNVLPTLLAYEREFTAYIIDGGHGFSTAESDLANILNASHKNSIICFDDTNMPALRVMLNAYMLSGKISNISDPGGYLILNSNHMFFRVN